MEKNLQLELGSIATGRYYEFQEIRKSSYNRIRNVVFRKIEGLDYREIQEKKKKSEEEKKYLQEYTDKKLRKKLDTLENEGKLTQEEREYINKIFTVLDDIEKKETQYFKLVEEFVIQEPIYTGFSEYVKGLGVLSTAMLLYYFGYCEKAKYPSSLWKFAGLTPDSKLTKGESGGFNFKCRMFCWRIGDSFIKQRTPRYRKVYDTEKARQLRLLEQEADNKPKRLGHADARARRKMVKKFLADYYRVCKTLTNQEQAKPYVIDKMGHEHFDDVLIWLEQQKQQRLKQEHGM